MTQVACGGYLSAGGMACSFVAALANPRQRCVDYKFSPVLIFVTGEQKGTVPQGLFLVF